MNSGKCLLDKSTAEIKLSRMALEIAEQLSDEEGEIIIFGIEKSGTVIAEHVAAYLRNLRSNVTVERLIINKQDPHGVSISKGLDLNNRNVIVADDVSNSGRTLLYAMQPLMHFYPRRIQTLVLVERMHKQFPIKPDYVGLSVATAPADFITVEVNESGIEGAFLAGKA